MDEPFYEIIRKVTVDRGALRKPVEVRVWLKRDIGTHRVHILASGFFIETPDATLREQAKKIADACDASAVEITQDGQGVVYYREWP